MVSEIELLHENRSRKGRDKKGKENHLRKRQGISKLEGMRVVGNESNLDARKEKTEIKEGIK
jgi:hypothetical protein